MLEFAVLGSGSNGNAYYAESKNTAILVDAGLSFARIKHRLQNMGKDIMRIQHIFVTHEHTDHVYGVPQMLKRTDAMLHANLPTLQAMGLTPNSLKIAPISTLSPIGIGEMRIEPFLKSHDAVMPLGFTIASDGVRIPIITDAGYPCKNVIREVKKATVLCLETNYDDDMLMHGRYPIILKKRIASDFGHLSNMQSAVLALSHIPSSLRALYLCHLSENNNTPDIALSTMRYMLSHRRELSHVHIEVSPRYDALDPLLF